jgi:hypothetical protein
MVMNDPIVEEIRSYRDEIAKEHNYRIDKIFAAFRAIEAQSGRIYTSLPPRKIAGDTAQTNTARKLDS